MCTKGGKPCGLPFCKQAGLPRKKPRSVKGRDARERAYMAEHELCEDCGALAAHCHHELGRGAGGWRRKTSPLRALCARCHERRHQGEIRATR